MDTQKQMSLGMSAEDFYNSEKSKRTGPVEVARRLADVTLPSLFPPEHYDHGDDLEITNQSINAFLINGLASNLALAAFPPNLPMASFKPREEELSDDIREDPELWSQVTYSMSRLEESHRNRLKLTTARSAYTRCMKLELVTGNACVLWTDIDKPRTYNMHRYVVKRDAGGEAIVTVLEDSVAFANADDDIRDAATAHWARQGKEVSKNEWDEEITIYHVQKLVKKGDTKKWLYWQEVEGGDTVEGSEAWAPYEAPHMYAAGLIPDPESDWYGPYCGDYEGDIQAIENFESALQDGAAAMAWFLFFVEPTGQTSIEDVKSADNLEVLSGKSDDVSVLQTQKGGDLAAVEKKTEAIARRLGIAFASRAALQRSGERVTAEEWQQLTEDLERAMGGLYTEISEGPHRWFVNRFIHLHELTNKKLPKLPKDLFEVSIITGIDAIGLSSDHSNLIGWAKENTEVLGPELFASRVNADDFMLRTATYRGVKTDGLIKSKEQQEADNQKNVQAQQQQTLLEQGAGPLAKEGAGMMAKLAMAQQEGASPNEQ